jgi:glycosyltransferase involved in cell wall biosynthesis
MSLRADIAVLMPAYNPGPEINDTLASLRNQKVPFKLFVIDDGSTKRPDYPTLLAGFDHHFIQSPHNIGVNEARNPALTQILREGFKYVALIDCGDIARPERLLLQKQFLELHPEVDILGSAIWQVYKVSGIEFELTFPETPDAVEETAWAKLPVSHPTLMFRREVFERIGLYTGQYLAAEDYELIRRALKAGLRIANLPDVLLEKIETSESVSHVKRVRQLQSRLAIQWNYRDLAKPSCISGLLRTSLIRLLPKPVIDSLKRQYFAPKPNQPKPLNTAV